MAFQIVSIIVVANHQADRGKDETICISDRKNFVVLAFLRPR